MRPAARRCRRRPPPPSPRRPTARGHRRSRCPLSPWPTGRWPPPGTAAKVDATASTSGRARRRRARRRGRAGRARPSAGSARRSRGPPRSPSARTGTDTGTPGAGPGRHRGGMRPIRVRHVEPPARLLADDLDGVLGAVGDRQPRLVLELGRAPRRRSPTPGRSRPPRRARARGCSSGRGPGTCRDRRGSSSGTPPGGLGGRGPVRRPTDLLARRQGELGMRASHSSSATCSSMRARFEPAQRWMPEPKATCRLWARSSCTTRRGPRMPRGRGWRPGSSSAPCRPPSWGSPVLDVLGDHRGPSSPASRPAATPRPPSASARARPPAAGGPRGGWRGATATSRSRSTSCRRRR